MSIQPLITFKAGKCSTDFESSPPKISPLPTPGFLYLYTEDELPHFCWRARNASLSSPELDLTMVPGDGTFKPYTGATKPAAGAPVKSPVNGRIFALKFSSSSTRHLFWLQSREQPVGDQSKFSPRDLRIGEIVNGLLQGEEMDDADIEDLRRHSGGDEDGDTTMGDSHAPDAAQGSGSGANGGSAGQRGGTPGGADSSSASGPSSQNQLNLHQLLASIGSGSGNSTQGSVRQQLSTTLPELLPTQHTIPALEAASLAQIDSLLLYHLPIELLEHASGTRATSDTKSSDLLAKLSEHEKRAIVTRVLRSAQFTQALASTTSAIRDGGLPGIGEALGLRVKNGGWAGAGQPLTGGAAVEAFIEGAKQHDAAAQPHS